MSVALTYRIDVQLPTVALIPCTFLPSQAAPGKTLCVNEDGSLLVVEPNGTQVRTVPPGDPAWDSPYTWGTVLGGLLVYRSATPDDPGIPRAYRLVV